MQALAVIDCFTRGANYNTNRMQSGKEMRKWMWGWNNGWNEKGMRSKAMLESGRCGGNFEGVEWGAWSPMYRRRKMAT